MHHLFSWKVQSNWNSAFRINAPSYQQIMRNATLNFCCEYSVLPKLTLSPVMRPNNGRFCWRDYPPPLPPILVAAIHTFRFEGWLKARFLSWQPCAVAQTHEFLNLFRKKNPWMGYVAQQKVILVVLLRGRTAHSHHESGHGTSVIRKWCKTSYPLAQPPFILMIAYHKDKKVRLDAGVDFAFKTCFECFGTP